jgi:hypothetical protein
MTNHTGRTGECETIRDDNRMKRAVQKLDERERRKMSIVILDALGVW